jgi:acetyl esterase/lipase
LFGLPIDSQEFQFEADVEFMRLGDDSFKCDVYSPAIGEGPFPVIINIHGGGWAGLDKDTVNNYMWRYFASAGYVVFSIQYGAVAEVGINRQYTIPEIMTNIAAFSDWMASPGIDVAYNLNLSRCFVTGYSAGGHLAALVATARHNVSAWNPAVVLRGGINFYGITDLRSWDNFNAEVWSQSLFSTAILADPTIVDEYSPVHYLQGESDVSNVVPLLTLHGDADSVVNITQGRAIDEIYRGRGLISTFIEIPKADHVYEFHEKSAGAQLSLWAMERFLQLC